MFTKRHITIIPLIYCLVGKAPWSLPAGGISTIPAQSVILTRNSSTRNRYISSVVIPCFGYSTILLSYKQHHWKNRQPSLADLWEGGGGRQRCPDPLDPIYFIFMQFSGKNWPNNRLAPPRWGWYRHSAWEILDSLLAIYRINFLYLRTHISESLNTKEPRVPH